MTSSSPSRPAPQVATPTPGPWHVTTSPRRKVLCVMADAAWICGELSNGNGERPGEGLANAHLIAAAPAMLDALRASKDAIRKIAFVAHKQSLTNEERVSDIASVSDIALTAVEAALALAHGAAPDGGEG